MPVVFMALAAYFIWGSFQGERGLEAQKSRQVGMDIARQDLDAAQQEQSVWQRRVDALRTENLDGDALDERVRDRLNLSNSTDIIMLYPPGKRLF
ncbi:MAG: septum formation initiator family protein [Acetobacteraceae bacterium]|nr:septum formation initiator family protein [Acetobacteraceae bacterium]